MGDYYLAVDIGASSGRHILGHMEDGKMTIEEIYRFPNGLCEKDGEACWDLVQLFEHIKTGLKKCREIGKIPVSMGIDTWGVDFVLLDSEEKVIGNTVGYRDKRTEGMDEVVYRKIPEEELYARTGIQKQIFNTIYQLTAIREKKPEHLKAAAKMLLIPDYFHYLLTGAPASEYTNATTTQLLSPVTKDWDWELIDLLGLPRQIFQEVKKPGSSLGRLTQAIQEEVGFDLEVVLPATHDTGSAVLAVPSNDNHTLYISSGTWSLMGVERMKADCSENSRTLNFTNEGGYDYRFRYLKNIMGLWMIQSVKKELQDQYSFAELCEMADGESISSLVDCNDEQFLAPDSMIQALQDCCRKSGQEIPHKAGELSRVIYRSLAQCYGLTVRELEEITGINYSSLHVVGGGANAGYLNQLTAAATGKRVLAGPTEATAVGNITVQMIYGGELADLTEARKCIRQSFPIEIFEGFYLNHESH